MEFRVQEICYGGPLSSLDHQLQEGGQISRIGQREKLDCDALSVSMTPLELE